MKGVTGDRILYGEDFIFPPLFAISEGGVRFPMNPSSVLPCFIQPHAMPGVGEHLADSVLGDPAS